MADLNTNTNELQEVLNMSAFLIQGENFGGNVR